jgi:hypothetical protein
MPGRPPRDWFGRCINPRAVCAAAWSYKGEAEKRALTRAEEPMPKKRKKKHAATKKRKRSHAKKHHPKRKATVRRPKRAKSKKAHKRHVAAKHAADTREFLARMRRLSRGV